ncbi:unnamed protein product [Miscanthus lutarioriparius]|uniref:RNA polymerase I-specific transcription initiation factor RRN3 n=1 Tax=Miscanthus lutarioriparius TaxID=422564 RepID=A0A811SCT8_9POAL|nr:unnamed protein product [Miscanthus lutarioriparius]
MGVEQGYDDMEVTISDSEAFKYVGEVLQSVRMDPFLIDLRDKDQYDILLGLVDPTKKRSSDDEAMFVTTLKALSEAVSKIDTMYHHALLHNAAVADQYLRECLQMLVNNFTPPGPLIRYIEEPRWLAKKEEIYSQLQASLKKISDTVPLAPRMLKDIIDRSMPKLFDNKAKMVSFVECMLGLDADVWDIIGPSLLEKVVYLLTELDVNITWEDILQDEHNKGIFDMELEDLDEDEDNLGQEGTKVLFGGNVCAEKLDGLMVVVCEHLKSRAEEPDRLIKEFNTLKAIFKSHVLRVHKSKFAQFIMFYACSLYPEICGDGMSAVSYVGSYLSRARFISVNTVVAILKRLVEWCGDYCGCQLDKGVTANPIKHQLFYASCQAVMYVLCFRLRSIMDYPNLKLQLFQMRIQNILAHPLEPLKVCLPSIVNEFLRQARAASLFHASVNSTHEDAVESDLSKAFGGLNRLDMFFPFDPYLLKESDRYIRPNFEFWSFVKTTYSNNNSDEDDDELADIDAPGMNVGSLDDHFEIDFNNDDDIEYSMNKMSITPHRTFYHPLATNSDQPVEASDAAAKARATGLDEAPTGGLAAQARVAADADAQTERETDKTTLRQVLAVRHTSFLACAMIVKLSWRPIGLSQQGGGAGRRGAVVGAEVLKLGKKKIRLHLTYLVVTMAPSRRISGCTAVWGMFQTMSSGPASFKDKEGSYPRRNQAMQMALLRLWGRFSAQSKVRTRDSFRSHCEKRADRLNEPDPEPENHDPDKAATQQNYPLVEELLNYKQALLAAMGVRVPPDMFLKEKERISDYWLKLCRSADGRNKDERVVAKIVCSRAQEALDLASKVMDSIDAVRRTFDTAHLTCAKQGARQASTRGAPAQFLDIYSVHFNLISLRKPITRVSV